MSSSIDSRDGAEQQMCAGSQAGERELDANGDEEHDACCDPGDEGIRHVGKLCEHGGSESEGEHERRCCDARRECHDTPGHFTAMLCGRTGQVSLRRVRRGGLWERQEESQDGAR
ncbi:MAG: hypothetical protein ABF453_10235 [Bifidobacterium psychraerophilum]|uniref:hypothetical protein n=1 Tax=Bifidobacterium psychraerophilum TaxID=218140 RepID=UPI0039E92495